jgi:hypothetical protein
MSGEDVASEFGSQQPVETPFMINSPVPGKGDETALRLYRIISEKATIGGRLDKKQLKESLDKLAEQEVGTGGWARANDAYSFYRTLSTSRDAGFVGAQAFYEGMADAHSRYMRRTAPISRRTRLVADSLGDKVDRLFPPKRT